MVLDIALGIVLAVIIIACLPLIVGGGAILIGVAIVAFLGFALIGFVTKEPEGALAIGALLAGGALIIGLLRHLEKRKWPVNGTDLVAVPLVLVYAWITFSHMRHNGIPDSLRTMAALFAVFAALSVFYFLDLRRRIAAYRKRKAAEVAAASAGVPKN